MRQRPGTEAERGQASVELVAVLPALLLAVLIAAQIGLAGHALWSAANAARAGARAAEIGGNGRAAARRALPAPLRSGARVDGEGAVRVRVAVPMLIPIPGVDAPRVGARSSLGDGG